jgi:hypothetical protein
MPNTLLREQFATHLRQVERLERDGIAPPKSWVELRDRFTRYRELPSDAAERLARQLIHPTRDGDVGMLFAHAVSEAAAKTFPNVAAQVDQEVAGIVEAKLLELYKPHAATAFKAAATRFNEAAAAFIAAAHAVNIEADAADMVAADDEARTAWVSAPQYAAQLDSLVPLLTVTAQLAGVDITEVHGQMLTLCVDVAGMHRRELWQAWDEKGGRTRRWGALTRLGARIRGADLSDVVAYRRAHEVQTRLEPQPGQPRGVYETVVYDPELPPSSTNRPPTEPEKGLIPGKRLIAR